MRNALGRLVLGIAEVSDRNVLTAPDFDLEDAYSLSENMQTAVTDGIA
jgi:hypothetical protein